jgi:hypothetical protein
VEGLRTLFLEGEISKEAVKRRLISSFEYTEEHAEAEIEKWKTETGN